MAVAAPHENHDPRCLVTVRREQLGAVLPALIAASGIDRVVAMVNHANGSQALFEALGRARVVLAFPGAAGGIEAGVVRYVDVREQATAVEASAVDVISVFRGAGFRVARVRDMDAWLRRHAVFITAVCGALYESGGNARSLAANREGVHSFVLAVREGWSALDRRGVGPASLALRAIFCWLPLASAIRYWRRLLACDRGEFYFARHARHAPAEMAALVADLRGLLDGATADGAPAPHLGRLHAAIARALMNSGAETSAVI
jgi:ketopantoate reductase